MESTQILSTTVLPSSDSKTTNLTTDFDYYNPGTPVDKAMDFLLVFALLLALYLLTVLSYYEIYLYRSAASKSATAPKTSRFRDMATWLRILCIFAALFSLLRCISGILFFKAKAMSDFKCTMLKSLGVCWLIEVDTAVYLFLWLRHRILFRTKSLRRLVHPIVTFASWSSLALIIGIFVVMNILQIWRQYRFDPTKAKCSKIDHPVFHVYHKLFLSSNAVLHFLLLVLYIYPLIQQSCNIKRSRQSENQAASIKRKKDCTASSTGKKSLMAVVVRCVIITVYCVVSDALVIVLTKEVLVEQKYKTKFRHFLYNLNVITNVFAIIVSFKEWKFVLFPFSCVKAQSLRNPRKSEAFILQTATTSMPTTNAITHVKP